MTDTTDPLVLNRQRVAALLDVPVATVDNLHRVGALPGLKIGKHLRWDRRDVQGFVDELRKGRID